MNSPPGSTGNEQNARPSTWARRLHGALMPDYNTKATAYWWTVVLLGLCALVASLLELAAKPPQVWLEVAGGMAIAMLAGFFPVRIPSSKNSFAAGEIFIFLLLLIHGPGAATLAAAGEGAIGSWRTSKRWTSRIVSPAMSALAMYGAAAVLQAVVGGPDPSAGVLIAASMLVSAGYFVINTLLVTAVPRLKRNERIQWADLFGVFGWVGIAYAGSAAVASLLYLVFRQSGTGVLKIGRAHV